MVRASHRNSRTAQAALLLPGSFAAGPAIPAQLAHEANLLELLRNPPRESTSLSLGALRTTLLQSKVPSEGEAARLALASYIRSAGLDARESGPQVVGLFRIARDVAGFAGMGDLVWELRVYTLEGTSGVIWVSTSTGNTRSFFLDAAAA